MNEKLPETALEKAQMPDLAEKDFKEAFTKVFKELMQLIQKEVKEDRTISLQICIIMKWIKLFKNRNLELKSIINNHNEKFTMWTH